MSLLGFLGFSKPSEKGIAKLVTKVKERYAQSDYRRMAMDKLLEWNTKESLAGLAQRFTVVVQSPHWDEEEKNWLIEEFVKKGPVAKDVLIEFLAHSNEVTHAIKALDRLCPDRNEFASVLVKSLRLRQPEDYKTNQSKMEMIAALDEYKIPNLLEAISPYLNDHNDDVQCMVLDVISHNELKEGYPQVTGVLSDTLRSARVLRHAAMWASKKGMPVDPKSALAPEVAEDYTLQNGHLLKK